MNLAPAFGNDCIVGLCRPNIGGHDPITGCIFANALDGTACEDDTYSCTNDTCLTGVCQHDPIANYCDPYFPIAIDPMCANITCTATPPADETTGCLLTAYADSTPCDDGINCTVNTQCYSGQCLFTVFSLDHNYCHSLLSPLEQPCQLWVCTGNASYAEGCEYNFMLYDGLPCPDNITCTDNICDLGTCSITDVDENCDPFSPGDCYVSICNVTDVGANTTTGCLFEPKVNGSVGCTPTPNVPCYTSTYCDGAGGCIGIPDDDYCNTVAISLDGCMVGTCDPNNITSDSNGCIYEAAAEGNSCTDGIPCTYNDTCVNGTCVGMIGAIADAYCETTPGAEGDCITGYCLPEDIDVDLLTGCVYEPVAFGANCSDGYACTYSDFCDGIGNCIGNENATFCPDYYLDLELCLVGECRPGLNGTDPITGCYNTSFFGDCGDGFTCTVDDVCNGVYCSGTPTQGPCDALLGPNVDPVCLAYTCNQTVSVYDNTTGCALTTNNTGSGCDDMIQCTVSDACQGDGTCAGIPDDNICALIAMTMGM
ncbi:MAG: hypothetical protein KDI15_14220, partial [Thiothrix sp.]|nr:hypothetical protein [Thiothrix sp.]